MLRTDGVGLARFRIPAASYKFRVDYNGRQYWSDGVNFLADEETAVALQLDLLALDLTHDPDPVILDGIPPKREQKPRLEQKRVLLASLFEISGMLANAVVGQIPPEGGIYYYINDHLGTPQRIIDQSGAVVWSGDYRPFGIVNAGVAGLGNSFRFAGQYYDEETGLQYNYHRYYDPALGRYLTPDPIGLAGGINPYVYVLNDPVNKIDLYGLAGIAIEAGGGIGIGGYKDAKSISDNAATGLYIGAKKGGHAELGAYTYQAQTKIAGGKASLGISFVIYYEDAEKVLDGTSYIDSLTFGPVSQTWIYGECGRLIGRAFSLWGVGGGASFERGKSEGILIPLQ